MVGPKIYLMFVPTFYVKKSALKKRVKQLPPPCPLDAPPLIISYSIDITFTVYKWQVMDHCHLKNRDLFNLIILDVLTPH